MQDNKTDKELAQHFKDLYDCAIEVIIDLLGEVNVYGPLPEGNRVEAKQLVREELSRREQS